MATLAQDPFNVVKQDILESLANAKAQQARWQSARSAADRNRLAEAVEDECKSIAWQVDEMGKAVDVAERNSARFGLSQAEVAARRKWILQTQRDVERLEAALKSGGDGGGVPATPTGKLARAVQEENESFLGSQQQRQQQIIRQQDQELDQLGESVTRIGHVGLQIHEELAQQGTMLDELDEDIEGTATRLQAAQKRMNHVLKKAGMRGQLCIILGLTALLAILVVMAFSP